MPEALTYPGARWHPLGAQTETRMTAHDLICLHTMVGYLASTDPYFRVTNGVGFVGTESHYGVGGTWGPDLGGGLDGAVWQWQDRAFQADANLDGGYRVISIETADSAPQSPADIPAWTAKQIEALARILAWESTPAAHAACPSSWTCHQAGIPLVAVPDSRLGHRGVCWHRQGVESSPPYQPGYRVVGGEKWSSSTGKQCPGNRRIAQIPDVIARARVITQPEPEDDMPTLAEIETMLERVVPRLVHSALTGDANTEVSSESAAGSRTWDIHQGPFAPLFFGMERVQVTGTDPQYFVRGDVRYWVSPEALKSWGLERFPLRSVGADDPAMNVPLAGPDAPQ